MDCRRTLLALAAVLAVTLSACAGSDTTGTDTTNAGATAVAGEDEAADHGGDHAEQESLMEPVEGAPELAVIARDIEFDAPPLELTAGEPVNVTIVNEGQALHDFTVEEAGVHVNVEPGESKTTALTIDEPGSYRAVCTVPGHEDAGMVIEIEVQ